jgi:hypothetical protein
VLWLAALVIPALLAIRGMWTIGLPDPFLLLVVVMSALGWLATTLRSAREVAIAIALLAPIGAPGRSNEGRGVRGAGDGAPSGGS